MEQYPSLSGQEVAFTGRLISMSRSEAMERVLTAGGRCVASPGSSTAFLVAGPALGHIKPTGDMAKNLVRFRELKDEGASIRIVDESEFLGMLGADEDLADLSRLYTATQVSRITETPLSSIRSWIRHGLLQPAQMTNRLPWFEFKDIMLARSLSRLSAAGVTTAEIRRSLSEVAHWLPDAQWALGRLEAADLGLRVKMGDGGWAEPSGQLLLDFDSRAPLRAALSPFPVENRDAQFWFSCALEAEEEGDLRAASRSYRRSLDESPDAVTYFNLGNVCYELGEEGDAAECYLAAVSMDPDFVEAWNNLGNALVALAKLEEAISAYERALSLEANYVDVHCNLAVVLDRLERHEEAAVHRAECRKAFPSESHLRLLRESCIDDDPVR